MQVYTEKGKHLKNLLGEVFPEANLFNFMDSYLAVHNRSIMFIMESSPKLTIIDPTELTVKKTINLEMPKSYKSMPSDFYALSKKQAALTQLEKNLATWKTSYSRITKALIEGDQYVIQVRARIEGAPKYTLLFYDANKLTLQDSVNTDDLLLESRDGKFYFYNGGNPSYDDEADATTINIYKLKK
jgi:hypothetical protein